MTEVTTRHVEGSDGLGSDAPGRRGPGRARTFHYATGEYTIHVGYAELTELIDEVFGVWDSLNEDREDKQLGDRFEDLVEHLAALREHTGWDGAPGGILVNSPSRCVTRPAPR